MKSCVFADCDRDTNMNYYSNLRVCVIGGLGTMGSWSKNLFQEHGHVVSISDPVYSGCNKSNITMSAESDIIVLAVPIGEQDKVLRDILPVLTDKQLLVELSAVKTIFDKQFFSSEVQALRLHPLFSPSVLPFSNKEKNCIVCSDTTPPLSAYVISILEESGLKLTRLSTTQHDQIMATVQGLTHFQIISNAITMNTLSFDWSSRSLLSPVTAELVFAATSRMLSQNPLVSAEIMIYNPFVKNAIQEFHRSCALISDLIHSRSVKELTSVISSAYKTLTATDT